jgi:hypothetical protein
MSTIGLRTQKELWGVDPVFQAYAKVLVSQVLAMEQATDEGTKHCIFWLGARAVSVSPSSVSTAKLQPHRDR